MIDSDAKPFYQPGGALPLDSRAYVKRAADDELFDYLIRGDYCSILTSRQMGKSSLIARTSARLRSAGVSTCVIDLSCMSDAISEPEKWYFGLVLKLGKTLGRNSRELAELWSSSEWPSPVLRWSACIEHLLLKAEADDKAFQLVVFLDEIDATRDMALKDGFFAMIRGGYNRRATDTVFQRIAFCLVGSARPTDLISDPHLTPFNIGRRIELSDFSEEEARALIPGMDRSEEEGKALLQRVLYWTGGHPYLTHRLCMKIAGSAPTCEPTDVDGLAATLFFSTDSREQDDNLAFVAHRVLTSCNSDRDVSRLLLTYKELLRGKLVRDHKSDPLLGVLHIAGLVRSQDGVLTVRNRIYLRVFDRSWVRENMPDAELRSVRAAYWRAALRWAGLTAIMTAVAVYALIQRRAAVRDEAIANGLVHTEHTLLMQSMQALWEHADLDQIRANLQNTPKNERNFEWRYWLRQINQDRLTLSDPKSDGARVAASTFAPSGSWLATSGKFPFIDIWDPMTGALLTRLPEANCPYTLSMDVSPNGKELVSGGEEGVAQIWDTRSWRPILRLDMGADRDAVTCVRFSPDGSLVAAATHSGRGTRVFDAATGRLRNIFATGRSWAVAFAPISHVLAVAGEEGRVTLWLPGGQDGPPIGTLLVSNSGKQHNNPTVDCLEFSPTGDLLAAGSKNASVRIWNVHTRRIDRLLEGCENGVSSVAFSPDGRTLAGVGLDRAIHVWDVGSSDQTAVVAAHLRWINCVAISTTGLLATSSDDGTTKVWALRSLAARALYPPSLYWVARPINVDGRLRTPAFTSDGRTGWLDVESMTWTPLAIPLAPVGIKVLGSMKNGQVIEEIDNSGSVFRWTAEDRPRLIEQYRLPPEFSGSLRSVALSPDGRQALLGLRDGTVAHVDLNTRAYRLVQPTHSTLDAGVAWTSDDRPIWSSGEVGHRTLFVSDSRFASPPQSLPIESSGGLYVSDDGKLLLAACVTVDPNPDPTLVDLNSMLKTRLVGHAVACTSGDFSPDGSRIVTGGADNTVRLWDAKEGVNLQTWRVDTAHPVLFAPDGNHIVAWQGNEMRVLSAANADEVMRWTKGWPNPK